ncbi:hypothetical protein NCG89_00795 [Spongiibacter taiwanensis]|uniref:hypothetical protein n=1 Tax=Spongiibacter taiwanensis TaxID=1748242 RepID=UPI0020359C4B|nr:hypothetical protein [Spongiibacter taiwanensis]USA43340.1 hypothetical protein NCG89_00795 [Spongiibacter taiwanensis]
MILILFLMLLSLLLGFALGWEKAHLTVARECELLGRFYVEKKVYHCHLQASDEETGANHDRKKPQPDHAEKTDQTR